jgi:hypothetical protein
MTDRMRRRSWFWGLLAVLVASFQLPVFLDSLRPDSHEGMDFFQEWSSAKNWQQGRPVYEDLDLAAERYLGRPRIPGEQWLFAKNAHPPPAVLLALPFAWVGYPGAMLAWNLLSLTALVATLWLIARGLHVRVELWMAFALIALGLLANPLRQQVNHGQLNLLLLLIIVLAWMAHRSERGIVAGGLIGFAAAVKVFPGFLVLFFALRGRWISVIAASATFVGMCIVSALVLGPDSWHAYVQEVAPTVSGFRNLWVNASLAGFWAKWFAEGAMNPSQLVGPPDIPPLWAAPRLAAAGWMLTAMTVIAVWAQAMRRLGEDQAFGASIIVMLLLSPVTWDHYFLLLILPVAFLWLRFPEPHLERSVLIVVLVILALSPLVFANAVTSSGRLLPLVGVSVHFFALCVLLMLSLRQGSASRGGRSLLPAA